MMEYPNGEKPVFQLLRGDDRKFRLYFDDPNTGIVDWVLPGNFQEELNAQSPERRDAYAELFGDLLYHYMFLILAIVVTQGVRQGGERNITAAFSEIERMIKRMAQKYVPING